jgi:hypothetical protein
MYSDLDGDEDEDVLRKELEDFRGGEGAGDAVGVFTAALSCARDGSSAYSECVGELATEGVVFGVIGIGAVGERDSMLVGATVAFGKIGAGMAVTGGMLVDFGELDSGVNAAGAEEVKVALTFSLSCSAILASMSSEQKLIRICLNSECTVWNGCVIAHG